MTSVSIPKTLACWPKVSARAILEREVEMEVERYREGIKSGAFVWLELPDLREALKSGEARFGARNLPVPEIDFSFAFQAAIEAVQDGAVMMFVDDVRVDDPEVVIEVREDSQVRYLRLYAQRGL